MGLMPPIDGFPPLELPRDPLPGYELIREYDAEARTAWLVFRGPEGATQLMLNIGEPFTGGIPVHWLNRKLADLVRDFPTIVPDAGFHLPPEWADKPTQLQACRYLGCGKCFFSRDSFIGQRIWRNAIASRGNLDFCVYLELAKLYASRIDRSAGVDQQFERMMSIIRRSARPTRSELTG
jgi:hypothetical protein